MKAVVLNSHGGIEQFEYVDNSELHNQLHNELISKFTNESNKLPIAKIKILYSTVNRNDITFRKGYDNLNGHSGQSPFVFPKILGSDAVGIIIEINNNNVLENEKHQIGDFVLLPSYFYDLVGNRYSLGINYQGTYCENIYYPLNSLINLSKYNFNDEDLKYLSTFPTAGLIAIKSFLTASNINNSKIKQLLLENNFQELIDLLINGSKTSTKDKQKLMALGANSGVGSFILEFAKIFNYEIVTSVGNPKNKKIIDDNINNTNNLKFDILLHYEDNFKDIIKQNYFGQIDKVIDFLGGKYIDLYLDLLKANGSIISIGGILGKNVNFNLQKLYSKNISLRGVSIYEDYKNYQLTIKLMEFLIYLYKQYEFKPRIFDEKELKYVAEFHKLLENSVYYGKFVLKH